MHAVFFKSNFMTESNSIGNSESNRIRYDESNCVENVNITKNGESNGCSCSQIKLDD